MATATIGFDTTSAWIDQTARKQRRTLHQSSALGIQPALDELSAVGKECRLAGWDGFKATPVEQATLYAAYRLLDSLPYGFPLPSISAQADGQLTFEWYRTPTRNFSISIDPAGLLHYAALFGPDQHHGTVSFFDRLPDRILALAAEV